VSTAIVVIGPTYLASNQWAQDNNYARHQAICLRYDSDSSRLRGIPGVRIVRLPGCPEMSEDLRRWISILGVEIEDV
jgi:hypothetical protein